MVARDGCGGDNSFSMAVSMCRFRAVSRSDWMSSKVSFEYTSMVCCF